MVPDKVCRSVVVGSGGRYINLSLCSRGLVISDTRRPSGACRSANSGFVGWYVISKDPVGKVSESGLIGLVVYVICLGCHPHGRDAGSGGAVRVIFSYSEVCFACI